MAKIRRIIRKMEPPHSAALDDQQWPVNVALVVLGAFSLGASLAFLSFDPATPWYQSAWTYVALTILLIGGAMLAFRFVSNRVFRRSMQLAIVASAIAHVVLIILSARSFPFTTITVESKTKDNLADRAPDARISLSPDLLVPDENEPRDFEKPVETPTPEVTPEQVVKKETPLEETSPRKPQPIPLPEPQPTQQPAVVKRSVSEEAAPRESPTQSQLSRNTQAREISPASSRAESMAEKPAVAAAVEPVTPSVRRMSSASRSVSRSETKEPTTAAPSESVAMAKKTTETADRPDTAATAALKRQVNQPALTPKSQVDMANVPAVAKRTSDQQPTPNNTAAVKRATTSPVANKSAQEPTPEAVATTNESVAKRELELTPQVVVATAPSSVPSRQARVTARPAATAEAVADSAPATTAQPTPLEAATVATTKAASSSTTARAAANPSESAAQPSPASTSAAAIAKASSASAVPSLGPVAASASGVTKTASGSTPNVRTQATNVATNTAPATSETLAPSASTAIASRQSGAASPNSERVQTSQDNATPGAGLPTAQLARATNSNAAQPTAVAAAAAGSAPQRAKRTALAAASPQNIEAPAATTGASGSEPSAAPTRLALNRAQSGVAGAGSAPNLDRGTGAGESPALTASVAARRNEATSAGPADAALTPSTLATRAHSRASAESPSSSRRAETIANATEGGAPQSSATLASSSAALSRATGSATAGEVSAAKGTADIDVGASTIVAETGHGRAAGGGQPELSFDPKMGNTARAKSAGSAQASLAVDKVAALAEAPMGTAAGEAQSIDAAATQAVRGDAKSGIAGGPSKAETQGELTEANAANMLAQSPTSRADMSAGGVPGEGVGSPEEDEEEKKRRLARAALAAAAKLNTGAEMLANAADPAAAANAATGDESAGAVAASTAAGRTAGAAGGADRAAAAPEAVASGGPESGTLAARAELASAAASPTTTIGGGTAHPTRASSGQALAAEQQAETLQLAGAPDSGGRPEGMSLQAQGIEAAKTSGGATSQIVEGAVGAAAGDTVVDAFGPQNAGNVAGGSRTVSRGTEAGPAVSVLATGTAPGRQTGETAIAASESGAIEVPLVGPTSAVAQADFDHGMGAEIGRTANDPGEGIRVNIDAPSSAGGIGNRLAADVGLNSRLARSDSVEIGPQPTRFVGRTSGGIPGISTASIVPTDSYKKRAEGRAGRGKLPPQTENSIEMGLQFLARFQQPDGSWRLQGLETNSRSDPAMVSDTAATALAVLSFQGAGYNHREHKYSAVVRNGLDHLVRNQQENGDLFVPLDDQSNRSVWLYSHALAALALCEAYGMTQDPTLHEPAQKAIDFIVAGQSKDRGGWRYSPGVGTDTSVTGTMLVALRSAELANLKVPKETFDGVSRWLDEAQAAPSQAYLYRYNPAAPDTDAQRHGRVASPTMTSLGLLMRLYLGWKRDNTNMVKGADFLQQNLPALGTNTDPKRDTYYWYYATQVMFHMGGEHWKQWHDKLHKLLLDTQVKEGPYAGSWNPRLPVADRWGLHGGRLYVTALNLLSLEVQYRHLPTYEDTAK